MRQQQVLSLKLRKKQFVAENTGLRLGHQLSSFLPLQLNTLDE